MSTVMSAREYQRLRVSHDGGVATLRLHNPARRNAIGPQMVNELLYALEDAHADEAVRSIVLTGDGEEAFCAGGDFSQMVSGDKDALPHKGDYAELLLALARATKPTIARVNGHAMGGGLGLVASAHFAIGAIGAKLGTPEIDVGLFPMMIMAVLARVMPTRQLTRMMLLGERLSAEDAVRSGLLHEAVPREELDAAVARVTGAVADKSPIALRLGLEAMAAQRDLDLESAVPLLRERLAACLATEDAREGLTAFLQKRKPAWTGR
jgi:enoyl-CoA hydratase/carnithine racemase